MEDSRSQQPPQKPTPPQKGKRKRFWFFLFSICLLGLFGLLAAIKFEPFVTRYKGRTLEGWFNVHLYKSGKPWNVFAANPEVGLPFLIKKLNYTDTRWDRTKRRLILKCVPLSLEKKIRTPASEISIRKTALFYLAGLKMDAIPAVPHLQELIRKDRALRNDAQNLLASLDLEALREVYWPLPNVKPDAPDALEKLVQAFGSSTDLQEMRLILVSLHLMRPSALQIRPHMSGWIDQRSRGGLQLNNGWPSRAKNASDIPLHHRFQMLANLARSSTSAQNLGQDFEFRQLTNAIIFSGDEVQRRLKLPPPKKSKPQPVKRAGPSEDEDALPIMEKTELERQLQQSTNAMAAALLELRTLTKREAQAISHYHPKALRPGISGEWVVLIPEAPASSNYVFQLALPPGVVSESFWQEISLPPEVQQKWPKAKAFSSKIKLAPSAKSREKVPMRSIYFDLKGESITKDILLDIEGEVGQPLGEYTFLNTNPKLENYFFTVNGELKAQPAIIIPWFQHFQAPSQSSEVRTITQP